MSFIKELAHPELTPSRLLDLANQYNAAQHLKYAPLLNIKPMEIITTLKSNMSLQFAWHLNIDMINALIYSVPVIVGDTAIAEKVFDLGMRPFLKCDILNLWRGYIHFWLNKSDASLEIAWIINGPRKEGFEYSAEDIDFTTRIMLLKYEETTLYDFEKFFKSNDALIQYYTLMKKSLEGKRLVTVSKPGWADSIKVACPIEGWLQPMWDRFNDLNQMLQYVLDCL